MTAVIDIGSTAIRMVIAEIFSEGSWRIVDRAEKPVSLGRDVFVNGKISRNSMMQSLQILGGFREILKGWQIEEENIQVIATSAIREARNRDNFIDRVAVKTGLKISIAEGIEENRLTYMAVQWAIQELKGSISRSNSIIIEVGGGSTEVMVLHRGKMAAAHSLNIGTVRMDQQITSTSGQNYNLQRFLHERVNTMCEMLETEVKMLGLKYFIAVGGDARIAARQIGRVIRENYSIIEKEDFAAFVHQLQNWTLDQIVQELQIPYTDAEMLLPGLFIYFLFLERTSAERLIVPSVSIREGVLLSVASGPDPVTKQNFVSQVVASAKGLGRKYHYDEEHANHVTKLSLSLFDSLMEEHGLDQHARLLLHISAILHDIGSFVNTSGHHKHSQYLVSNSEIFGLHRDDIIIVSNVLRYHRKSLPQPSHRSYISLSRKERVLVMKLAALLRVADALDRAHSQRISKFTIEQRETEVVLNCEYQGDISLERMALDYKGNLFEEVYGLKVVIV